MPAGITAIAHHLPSRVVDNHDLAARHPRFQPDKIAAKVGIERRHIAAEDECASDLAVAAAEKLLRAHPEVPAAAIDYLIFCTQAPDYLLPGSANLIHARLGLAPQAGALDVNLGCSGFVYGLGLASGLIQSGQARRVLLLTADTYSKVIDIADIGLATIFGDAGAATLIEDVPAASGGLGPFVYGADGKGAGMLIVPSGGFRGKADEDAYQSLAGPRRAGKPLYMNGPEVFNFTLNVVPPLVRDTLAKAGLAIADIDLFVFHQANAAMLEALRTKLGLPPDRFWIELRETGNTVSSTIPIALDQAHAAGRLRPGMRLMLVGFGVGLSWAACIMRWPA